MGPKEIDRADKTYLCFVREIKERVTSARISAARSVNRELIGLYWDIGKAIVKRQKKHRWGNAVVEMLSKDLQAEFPSTTGFSPRNLWNVRRLYTTFSSPEMIEQVARELRQRKGLPILQQAVAEFSGDEKHTQATFGLSEAKIKEFLPQLVAEIPWGHHRFLLDKISDPAAILYYLQATAQIGFGMKTDIGYCLGTGKNEKFLRLINNENAFLKKIIALEHPRYVMQYKSKFKNQYIEKYIGAFNQLG